MAVRAAASLCVHLGGQGGCAILLPGDRRPIEISRDLAGWASVHARLALVESAPAPPASILGPRGGAVIWVTGAASPARRACCSGFPPARGSSWRRPRCAACGRCSRSRAAPAAWSSARGAGWRHERRRRHAPAHGSGPTALAMGEEHRPPSWCAWPSSPRWRCSSTGSLDGAARADADRADAAAGAARHRHRRGAGRAGRSGRAEAARPEGRPARRAARLGRAGSCSALAAVGLPLRMFGPRNWAELADGIDRGLAGIQSADWPYDGARRLDSPDDAAGRGGADRAGGRARVLPGRPRRARCSTAAALAALLAVYATAVSLRDPGTPLLRGLALLLLVGAWLWLPRLRAKRGGRRRGAGAGARRAVAAGGGRARQRRPVVGLPLLDAVRQRQGDHVRLDAPLRPARLAARRDDAAQRRGRGTRTTGRPRRSTTSTACAGCAGATATPRQALQDIPDARTEDGSWDYFEWNRKWDDEVRFTVRSLSTDLLVGAGTPYLIQGAGFVSTAGDGTTRIGDGELQEGDSYTVRTYDPKPSARQMRGAPGGLSGALLEYTTIDAAARARGSLQLAATTVILPLWGSTSFGDPEAPRTRARAVGVRRHVRGSRSG